MTDLGVRCPECVDGWVVDDNDEHVPCDRPDCEWGYLIEDEA